MEQQAGNPTIAIDACIFITVFESNESNTFNTLPDYKLVATRDVISEVRRPHQARFLQELINAGTISEVFVDRLEELNLFVQLIDMKLGHGEASSIAVAYFRNWFFATDEKGKCRRVALDKLGAARVLTSENLQALAKHHR